MLKVNILSDSPRWKDHSILFYIYKWQREFYYNNILPQKSIEEVSEEVEQWAVQRIEELDMLRTNAAFRNEFLMNVSPVMKTPSSAIQG